MKTISHFFGYGSLINRDSLKETAPNVSGIKPSFIYGYKREFGVWDSAGFVGDNRKHTGEYALNIKRINSPHSRVNGVFFSLQNSADVSRLLDREDGYVEINEQVYDYITQDALGFAEIFEVPKDENRFLFGSRDQEEYLKICLAGAKMFGESFYSEFIHTTYIGNLTLFEIPKLRKYI